MCVCVCFCVSMCNWCVSVCVCTWVLLLELGEVGVAVENWSHSGQLSQSFFFLPLQHAPLSCGHHILLALSCRSLTGQAMGWSRDLRRGQPKASWTLDTTGHHGSVRKVRSSSNQAVHHWKTRKHTACLETHSLNNQYLFVALLLFSHDDETWDVWRPVLLKAEIEFPTHPLLWL